jgi:hypothetical protein
MTEGKDLTGELDVVFSSPEEFGRIAMAWLDEGVRALAGDISEEILAGPPLKPYWHEGVIREEDPRFEPDKPSLWGEVRIVYPSRSGGHYMKPYGRTSLKRLAALAPTLKSADVTLERSAGEAWSVHILQVRREGEESGHARLVLPVRAAPDYTSERPDIAFLRDFARRHEVAFGHVSPVSPSLPGDTQLELALRRHTWQTLPEWNRYLRGYSWITVVPGVLASRLGGAAGLRDNGAFAAVEELAGGAVWLEATPLWSEYSGDQAAVDRVFEALVPVLPAGMPEAADEVPQPQPGRGRGFTFIEVPYLLSVRDPAEFREQKRD